MTIIRNYAKDLSIMLAVIMLLTAAPFQAAQAKMLSTGMTADAERVQIAKDHVKTFMAKDEVKQQLTEMGIAPEEAVKRVNTLSDAEVVSLSDTIKESPAGASAVGTVVGAILLVFLVLLITDIMGYTNVYHFTR